MCPGEIVIGERGKEVVQGVKPQADRHRHLAQQSRIRVVHRVEQLIDKGHLAAGIDVAVRSQGANVIEIQNADGGGVSLNQESQRHPAANEQNRRDEANQKASRLLQPENTQHFAAGQRSRITGVHHQRRSMPVQPSPNEGISQPSGASTRNRSTARIGMISGWVK